MYTTYRSYTLTDCKFQCILVESIKKDSQCFQNLKNAYTPVQFPFLKKVFLFPFQGMLVSGKGHRDVSFCGMLVSGKGHRDSTLPGIIQCSAIFRKVADEIITTSAQTHSSLQSS